MLNTTLWDRVCYTQFTNQEEEVQRSELPSLDRWVKLAHLVWNLNPTPKKVECPSDKPEKTGHSKSFWIMLLSLCFHWLFIQCFFLGYLWLGMRKNRMYWTALVLCTHSPHVLPGQQTDPFLHDLCFVFTTSSSLVTIAMIHSWACVQISTICVRSLFCVNF